LKFSDNDQLAWLVAKVVNAKLLILLSDIDWLYKNYWKENQELIEEVRDIESIRVHSNKEKKVWSNWTGLMDSKLNVFAEMLKNWIIWILTNWWEQYIIKRIFEGTDCKRTVFRV
jgi:glutamate 5-kinase